MQLVVTTPPAKPLVSLRQVKQHLRLDEDDGDQDLVITTLVNAAVETIDAPRGWLGRALGRQSLELRTDGFPCAACLSECSADVAGNLLPQSCNWSCGGWQARDIAIVLPYPPIVSVDSIAYRDAGGTAQTLDPLTTQRFGRLLLPADGTIWPAVRSGPGAVTIGYTAGYDAESLPDAIVAAVLLMTSALYENRDGGSVDLTEGTIGKLLTGLRLHV